MNYIFINEDTIMEFDDVVQNYSYFNPFVFCHNCLNKTKVTKLYRREYKFVCRVCLKEIELYWEPLDNCLDRIYL